MKDNMVNNRRFEDMTLSELRELKKEIERKVELQRIAGDMKEREIWVRKLNALGSFVNEEVKSFAPVEEKKSIFKIANGLINKVNKKWKKRLAAGGLALTMGGLAACNGVAQFNPNGNQESAIVEEANTVENNEDYYDETLYSRNPISSETILGEATAWKELYAKYGLLEEGKYSDVHFTFLASPEGMNEMTESQLKEYSVAGTKDRKGVTTVKAAETIVDQNYQNLVTMLMTRDFKIDWSKFLSKKYDVKKLNEMQALYERAVKDNSESLQKDVRDYIDSWSRESESISSEAAVYLTGYVTFMRNYDVINDDFYNMAVTYLDGNCKANVEKKVASNNACGAYLTGAQELDSSMYQNARRDMYVKAGYAIDLSLLTDSSRFLTIVDELAKKDIKNQDYNASKAASSASMEYEMSLRGGEVMTANDYANMNPDGTINGGAVAGSASVGDVVSLPDTTVDGEIAHLSDSQLSAIAQMAATDKSSGAAAKSQAQLEAMYPGNGAEAYSTYMSVYNQIEVAVLPEGEISSEEKTEDVYFDKQPTQNVTVQENTTQQETEAPVVEEFVPVDNVVIDNFEIPKEDIISDVTTTEDIYFDNVISEDATLGGMTK